MNWKSAKIYLALAAIVVIARVGIIGITLLAQHKNLAYYSSMHDGREYQMIARAIPFPSALKALPSETQRLFPGYPAAIRVVSLPMPMPAAALAVSILSAFVAVVLFYKLSRDFWLAALMAVFTPSWLLYSSLAMSEGLFLAAALVAFLLWLRRGFFAAGMLFGILFLIRPIGGMIWGACLIAMLLGPNRAMCLKFLFGFLILPAIWMAFSWWTWGDALRQFHAYTAKDLGLPFEALMRQTFSSHVSLVKKALVWFTLLTNLGGLILLGMKWARQRTEENLAWLLWQGLVMGFLLALPSTWAFGSLDRFFVACLPPMLVGYSVILPRKQWILWGLGICGIAICLYWNANMIAAIGR